MMAKGNEGDYTTLHGIFVAFPPNHTIWLDFTDHFGNYKTKARNVDVKYDRFLFVCYMTAVLHCFMTNVAKDCTVDSIDVFVCYSMNIKLICDENDKRLQC